MNRLLPIAVFALLIGCTNSSHTGISDVSTTSPTPDAETTRLELASSCIATLPGTLRRSPAVAKDGDIVVVIEPTPDGVQLAKLAPSGEIRWLRTLVGPGYMVASPPVIRLDGEILLTVSNGGKAGLLLRIDPVDGSEISRINLGPGPHFAPAPLPTGSILITSGHSMRALDRSGATIWARDYDAPVSSDIVVGSSSRVGDIVKLPEGGGKVVYRTPADGPQRLAAFGLESGELVWLELDKDSTDVLREKRITLRDPDIPDNLFDLLKEKRFIVRQPGAFDSANLLFVVAVDQARIAVSPSGEMVWGIWRPDDWLSDTEPPQQFGPPTFQQDGAPFYLTGWGHTYSAPVYDQLFPFPHAPLKRRAADTLTLWGSWPIDFPPPAAVHVDQSKTIVLEYDWVNMFDGFTIDRYWITGQLQRVIITSPLLYDPLGLFVAGSVDGCLLGISVNTQWKAALVYNTKQWPRYRYDNRNSAVRW